MQFDRAKLKTVILFACAGCNPSELGAVKLHKVLYFADMLHYAHVGSPITGSTYRKRALGPTCDQLLSTIADLVRERRLEVCEVDYFGFSKKEFVPLAQAETERLNESEISLLNEVIEFACRNNTAKTISEFSHNRAWELAEFGDILPYHSVFHLFPTEVSQGAMEWASSEVSKLEGEGSQNKAVGGTTFRDFRKRVLAARGQ
jgi:hypothetical protein